jgi:hypothetical protein
MPRLALLNPRVELKVVKESISSTTERFFDDYHIVCVTRSNPFEIVMID